MTLKGTPHHIELRVSDLEGSAAAWGWLLGELGYKEYQKWPQGISWILGSTYLVLEEAPGKTPHDRRNAGLSHLAFHTGSRHDVDSLWESAVRHGWTQLYIDRHPFAGGPGHYAAYLENTERFKVELVAG